MATMNSSFQFWCFWWQASKFSSLVVVTKASISMHNPASRVDHMGSCHKIAQFESWHMGTCTGVPGGP